jgi:hypothetical protein
MHPLPHQEMLLPVCDIKLVGARIESGPSEIKLRPR